MLISFQSISQNNIGFQWQRRFGGTNDDEAYSVAKTADGGFIIAGYATSNDGDVGPGSRDSSDVWIIKFNQTGAIQWKKTYGGTKIEYATDIIQTADGGYVFVGQTSSNDGDVSGNKGLVDSWVVKLNSTGVIQWQRCLGGSNNEESISVTEAADGGIVIGAATSSNNGDVIGKPDAGNYDAWIVKLNSTGTAIVWQKLFRGSKEENVNDIKTTSDGGFIVTGSSSSNDLDFTGNGEGNAGRDDMFLIKLDNAGNTVWKNMYHSLYGDIGAGVTQTADNGYIVAGSFGNADTLGLQENAWIIKTNATGTVQWQKQINNISDTSSILIDVIVNADNSGYTFSGYTFDLQYKQRAWMLQTDLSGNIIWQKTHITPTESAAYRLFQGSDGSFTTAGFNYPSTQTFAFDVLLLKTGPVNIIKGSLFFDANSNGIKDASELFFNNATVKTQKTGTVFTAQPNAGKFSFDVDTGSYTTTVQLFNPYYTVVPASKNTNFTTYFNVDSFSFAVQPIPNQQDLIVHLIPASPARPGFKSQYVLNYKNVGTTTIANGTVKLIKDSRTSLSLSLPVPTSVVADTITWAYTNLKPLDSISIGIEMNVAPPPAVNINDTLKFTAVVLPVVGDLTPANDTARLRQRVQGSYDPNDKQESYAGRMPIKDVTNGSYINYVIRFQNTGNDTAFFVRLLDTLDAKLDWNSFQMIGSSHAYNLTIKDGNKLNWFFDNIKLPDSTTNLSRSIGYVAFRIKPKNTLVANDVIANKVSIYFDYNLPVVTNTTLTTVVPEVVTVVRDVQNNEMKLIVAPNPNAGQSVLQISGKLVGKFELKMIDNTGRIIMNQTLTRNNVFETLQVPMDLQKLPAGVYYIQLQQKEKLWWQKVVLQ
jgi:uncharacterized repeat protein (TIGR01451 family)